MDNPALDIGQPGPASAPINVPFDQLPEDLRAMPTLEKFKGESGLDVAKAVRSYIEMEKLHGASINLPAADAPEEKWAEFYDRIGRPKSDSEYQVTVPIMHQGVQWNLDLEKEFRTYAHKHGMSQKQFQAIIDFQADQQNRAAQEQDKFFTASDAAMQEKYGGEYARVKEFGRRLALSYDQKHGGNMAQTFWENFASRDPLLVDFMAWSAESLMEAGFIDGKVEGRVSKVEAKAELDRMMANAFLPTGQRNPDNPLWNDRHPGHKQAVERRRELEKIMEGM